MAELRRRQTHGSSGRGSQICKEEQISSSRFKVSVAYVGPKFHPGSQSRHMPPKVPIVHHPYPGYESQRVQTRRRSIVILRRNPLFDPNLNMPKASSTLNKPTDSYVDTPLRRNEAVEFAALPVLLRV
jgi:hypothetical protein